MKLEKSTKNTFRFMEITEDTPLIGTLYIRKSAFPGEPPESIRLSIEWE